MKKGKLELLEVSRGMGTCLIVLLHISISAPSWFNYQIFSFSFDCLRIAVFYFFLLSGFIMCYAHWDDMGGGYQKAKDYFLKRVIRIFPTYWLILIVTILIYYLTPMSSVELQDPTSHRMTLDLTGTAILKNIFFINYPTNPIVLVAWTIQYEIFFYIIFTMLILNITAGVAILSAWLIYIVFFSIGAITTNSLFLEFLGQSCNGQLILGCFISYFVHQWSKPNFKLPFFLLCVGLLGLIATGMFDSYSQGSFTGWYAFFPYTLFCSLIMLSLAKIEFVKEISCPKILSLIGLVSYPIYLTHPITQAILFRIIHKTVGNEFSLISYLLFFWFVFFASLIGGYLFYIGYDKPVTTYLRKKLKKKKIQVVEGLSVTASIVS